MFIKIIKKLAKPLRKKIIKRKLRREKMRIQAIPRNRIFYTNLYDKNIMATDSNGYYELQQEIFQQEVYNIKLPQKDNYYIIDGGANIGLASIYWKMKYPNAIIEAFEPAIKVFKALQYNIDAFNFKN